jgi:hypothetical protein
MKLWNQACSLMAEAAAADRFCGATPDRPRRLSRQAGWRDKLSIRTDPCFMTTTPFNTDIGLMRSQFNKSHCAVLSPARTLIPTILLFAAGLCCSRADIIFPPSESNWETNKSQRADPRPLELGYLASQPTIDGQLSLDEWTGATTFEVRDSQSTLLGVLRMGVYNGFMYAANNWLVNTNPNPLMGGGNAWRVGTSTGSGPENSGNGTWYVYVREGISDVVQARQADTESLLQYASFTDGSFFGILAGSFFDGQNWQYELYLGQRNPGPGPLPPCWHWEWRQLDPLPTDGRWEPVFDGSIHIPEPWTFSLLALGGLALLLRRRS